MSLMTALLAGGLGSRDGRGGRGELPQGTPTPHRHDVLCSVLSCCMEPSAFRDSFLHLGVRGGGAHL